MADIPVQVSGQEAYTLGTNIATMTGSPVLVVEANSARRALYISNNSTNVAYIGHADSVSSSNGYALPAGRDIKLNHYKGRIWADGTNADVLTYLEEAE